MARDACGFLDIETVRVSHYESDDLPTGSVARLEDGRYLVSEEAMGILKGRSAETLAARKARAVAIEPDAWFVTLSADWETIVKGLLTRVGGAATFTENDLARAKQTWLARSADEHTLRLRVNAGS